MTSHSVLILVPAYNAADHLPELLDRIEKQSLQADLLVVNDGSADSTEEILSSRNITHLTFPENRGKGAALMEGFDWAVKHGYRSVLTLDADLQHLPEEIPRFLKRDDGCHVIIGTRDMDPKVMPWHRSLTNNLTSLIISIFSSQRVRDSQSGYRLIPASLLKTMPLKTVGYDLESEQLFKAGTARYPIAEVPISTVYEGSHSYINPVADTLRFVRQIWRRIWG